MESYVWNMSWKFHVILEKIQITMNFWKKSEENSYQIQNMLKNSKKFGVEVYFIIKIYNIYTMVLCHSIFENVDIE